MARWYDTRGMSAGAVRLLVVLFVVAGFALLFWDRLRSAYGYVKAYAIGWLLSTTWGRRVLQAMAYNTTLSAWGL